MSPPRCDKSGRAWAIALPRAGEHWEAGEASLPAPLFAFTSLRSMRCYGMRLLLLFDLGFWLCSRWILHAVLLQPLLLLYEGGRILSKFVAHSGILR